MSSAEVFDTRGEDETRELGSRLGRQLHGGQCLALIGDLGSGKTRFVQGLAAGLGIDPADVSSPTFVLCHIYEGRLRLYHVDAYRLKDREEFENLGVLESLDEGAIVVIEWADKVAAALPDERIDVHFIETGEQTRQITIRQQSSTKAL